MDINTEIAIVDIEFKHLSHAHNGARITFQHPTYETSDITVTIPDDQTTDVWEEIATATEPCDHILLCGLIVHQMVRRDE